MAKESVKARQKKREKMVAQYAEKRKALKEAGDYRGLDLLPKIVASLQAAQEVI
jgi:small subunit ribosomal protein S14